LHRTAFSRPERARAYRRRALERFDNHTHRLGGASVTDDSYLVDPASSHMLVSKIKPCMSKFTLSHGETANGSLNQSMFIR
jgi:hypothetical protein